MLLKKTTLLALIFSFSLLLITSCGSDDDSSDSDIAIESDDDINNGDDNNDGNDNGDDSDDNNDTDGDCDDGQTTFFVEEGGILTIESENSDFENTEWSLENTISGFSDEGYLVWTGETFLGNPGNGLLTYNIRISTPGTYRFIWRSYITIGDQNGEYNDSWLRIPDADHFYGMRNDGHIVYPKGTELDPIPESEGQASTEPEGAGADGWFKVYMNTLNQWAWISRTSDNDAHNIYVVFDNPGDYTIEISGRSMGHAIDKFVLFTEDISVSDATNESMMTSSVVCD